MSVDTIVSSRLDDLKRKGLFRTRRVIESAQSTKIVLNGKPLLNFCSNDYLGLANHPELVKSFKQAADKYGVGSGASSLVCGRSVAHAELEEEVERITGRDKALVFSSGYLANLAIIGALTQQRGDCVFQDKLNHASMIDAALMSQARLLRYPHCDVDALRSSLSVTSSCVKLVLTDSIFSMDGDMAPLSNLVELSAKHSACLVVDDAHGFGVFGTHGGGALDYLNLDQSDVPVMMATFGKAIGCAGAFVAGSEDLIELLVQKARPYIYSTALAPALAVAAKKGLRLIETESWRRQCLFERIERFRKGIKQTGLPMLDSFSPIQPLIVGSASRAVEISDALLDLGFLITAIRPPTVPKNTSRLRITISANHTENDIDRLIDALLVCCDKADGEIVESA
jgi:8-amino-7-oxononanoate synthase